VKILPYVNVLIALFDTSHQHHITAKHLFIEYLASGWCTCSLTQNGFVRIVSNPSYTNNMPVSGATRLLKTAIDNTNHTYVGQTVSLLDTNRFETSKLLSHKQITDLFLIGMPIHHEAKLITFERSIPTHAAIGFNDKHLIVI
jgi:toxin-antitoxin system PIN domain toxin